MSKRISTVVLALALAMTAVHGKPQDSQHAGQRLVKAQALDLGRLGLGRPAGLAYSSADDRFILLETDRSVATGPRKARIGMLTRSGEAAGIRRLQVDAIGPACAAYDDLTGSLYLLGENGDLVQIEMRDGSPQPAVVERLGVGDMALRQPSGIAFDSASGSLFILDGGTSSLLRVDRSAPVEAGGHGAAAAIAAGQVSRIELWRAGLTDLRGVAVSPDGSRIYVLSGAARKVYEVTPGGEVVAAHDLSGLGLTDPRTLVLAPSGDPTDDPAQRSLYLLDGRQGDAGAPSDVGGSVVELYLLDSAQQIQAATVLASVENFQSSLVRTTRTSLFSPPSPDPSGVAYMTPFGRLMISDGEVEEMSIFAGANLFEVTPTGSLRDTSSTTAFSDEPVGAAFNPSNWHLFISDDNADRIFEIDPRGDGLFGTGDDVVTSISTTAFGSGDPEGLAYNTLNGYLYVADGVGREVYEIRPGPDGRFNGVPPAGDDQVSHFDVFAMGLLDTEGIEHNPDLDRLYVVDRETKVVAEMTTTGTLMRTIDISSAASVTPAGLAYGPSSVNPAERSLYIVDRGLDNDSNPNENDGKMYEMTLPGPPLPPGQAILDVRVAAGADDAEENTSGKVTLTSADLDMMLDGTTLLRMVGLRFNGISIPRGSRILSAYVQFRADEASSNATSLTIRGQNSDNALPFTTANANISSRPATGAAVSWSPLPWTTVGQAGPDQRTSDLSAVLQEIVNRGGWVQGNSLVLMITGSGRRVADPFEGGTTAAPLLHVLYEAPSGGNQPPNANAGADQTVTLAAGASLSGSVSDDGLPSPPGQVTVAWTQVGGPGTASFSSPTSLNTGVTFSVEGTYTLRLTADDSALTDSDDVVITVIGNQPPVANAGADQTVNLAAGASLSGSVSDDGLPSPPGQVTVAWTQVGGQGTASFSSPTSLNTGVTFSVEGTYTLRLTANDSALTDNDDVTITVIGNQPPVANAGADQTVNLAAGASLSGSVSDDGLPSPPGQVTVAWTQAGGPGTASFSSPTALDTGVTFSVEGVYTLRLTADDSALTDNDDVTISVIGPGTIFTLDVRVAAGTDDAEERTTGAIALDSSDLDMMLDGTTLQRVVGVRFNGVTIPQGSTIVGAYLQFRADEATSDATTLTIRGEDSDNAAPFTTVAGNISSRPTTSASASWSPDAWTLVGETGPAQRTPGLESILQQIVSRPGWAGGNSMVIMITGSGRRVADPFEGGATAAPLLHVLYQAPGGNQMPLVNAGPDQTVSVAAGGALLSGSVSDDGLPDPPGQVTVAWTQAGGPGTATFSNPTALNTGATFSVEGTYTLRLTADDSALTHSDDVTIAVLGNQPPVANAGADQTVTLAAGASLSGSVSDDGLPDPPGQVSVGWTQISGPGTATFSNPTSLNTGVTFSAEGTYTLRLTADDSALTDNDDVTITVIGPGTVLTLDVRVAAALDDAEERTSGTVYVDSADLDMMLDGTSSQQAVGLRFNGVTIPQGSTILSAYLQFRADEATADLTTLTIRGEASDNAAPFAAVARNISSRPTTSASVPWSPDAWTLVDEIGPAQRTPGLESILQEIVSRPGWAGNAMVIIITGSGRRVADAFEGGATVAPLLHVEFRSSAPASAPALSITKTDAPDPVAAGSNITYMLSFNNTGTADATGVVISDTVPANTTFVSATGGGTESGGVVTWSLGALAAGASGSAELVVRVASPLPDGTLITNGTYSIDSNETVPRSGASITTTVSSAPVLSISKTDAPDPVAAGSSITYTLSFSNTGNANATGVVISDTVPANTTFVSATGGGTESVLFHDDFEDGVEDGWSEHNGSWSVVSSGSMVYQQSSITGDGTSSAGESGWVDYTVEARIKPVSFNAAGGFVRLIGRFQDVNNYYYLLLRSTQVLELKKLAAGAPTTLSSKAFTVSPGSWYTLKLELVGASLKAYVNGQLELSATDSQFNGGSIGVGTFNASGEADDVVVRVPGPGGVVTWNVGALAAGGSGSVQLVVQVASPLPDGTLIVNDTYSIDSNETGPTSGASEFTSTATQAAAQAVIWTSTVDVTVTGNSIQKTAGCEGCPAGAVSQQSLVSGDGYVEFTAEETDTLRAAGLSNGNTDASMADIDFAIQLNRVGTDTYAVVRENDVYQAETFYVSGDLFRVAVEGGQVTYRKNGTLFHTSTQAPVYPLLMDSSLSSLGATISAAIIFTGP